MDPTGGLPLVIIRMGDADRVVAGHPWIYAGGVVSVPEGLEDGAVVAIKDQRGRFLGSGFYNSRSKIRVRWVSPTPFQPDVAFFESRLGQALEVRRRHLPGATSFRLVNAESDGLSGLIIDCYEDVFVLQTSSLGMDRCKPAILAALGKLFGPRVVVERNDASFRRFEGMEPGQGFLLGSLEGPIPARINGLTLEADPLQGHKTGLYLDQQVNYRMVGGLVGLLPGARVLDCFCFQGAFAMHAARAGASSVLGIDQSQEATAAATRLAALNGLADRCAFETANVFDWLKSHTSTPPNERLIPSFDAVVLDPPSFTRTRESVYDALRGYKEIHLRALKLLKTGGLLATFCCSHHVDAPTFMDTILSAAFDARRVLRRVAVFSQSPDHPVLPSIPETEYLKGWAFEVVR